MANTVISSAGTTPLSSSSGSFTGTFKADAVGATFTTFGFNLQRVDLMAMYQPHKLE
ncbi:MAG: hypothetical protein R2765_03395 [Ferruginibacter sp.]